MVASEADPAYTVLRRSSPWPGRTTRSSHPARCQQL